MVDLGGRMFNKKTLKTKETKKIQVRFSDFSNWENVSDSKKAVTDTRQCFNFIVNRGDLEAGYGFKKLKLPISNTDLQDEDFNVQATEVLGMWMTPIFETQSEVDKYYVFYIDENKKVFFFNIFSSDKFMYEEEIQFNEIPCAATFRINGLDTILFSSPSDQTVGVSVGGVRTFDNIPKFLSGCWHGNYFFLVTVGDKNNLVYSTETIANWNDDNKFDVEIPDVRGGLKFVVSFNDDLYIFRDYGIIKLSLYGSGETKFNLQNIYYSSAYIYPSSIAKNGDYIIFTTQDGIYTFDGANVKKVELPVERLLNETRNSTIAAACFDNKYFLACKINFDDEEQIGIESGDFSNNAVVVYDLIDKTTSVIRGIDVRQFCVINTPYLQKLCAIFRGEQKACIGELTKDGTFFGEALKKVWKSPKTDFGYAENLKRIMSVTVKPHTVCQIVLESENGEKVTINSQDCETSQRFIVNLLGKSFAISFISQSDQAISNPEFEVKVVS